MSIDILIEEATREQRMARVALDGPSGSGKTFTGLGIATYFAEKEGGEVVVIDTENGSASIYSGGHPFRFKRINLTHYSPDHYIAAIQAAEKVAKVIVVDSLSHAWEGKGGVLDIKDAIAARSSSKNSFDAWRSATPQHNKLVDALIHCKAHLVVTMRVKSEYVVEQDERGKSRPRKVGLRPVQRDGLEYEFDVVADMSQLDDRNVQLLVSKSRCQELSGGVYTNPGEDFASTLHAWLKKGDPAKAKPVPQAKAFHQAPPPVEDDVQEEEPSPIELLSARITGAMSLDACHAIKADLRKARGDGDITQGAFKALADALIAKANSLKAAAE